MCWPLNKTQNSNGFDRNDRHKVKFEKMWKCRCREMEKR